MGTAYSTHAWHRQYWWCNRAWSQINDTFTIGPWTSNTLRRTFAYKQTVAWTSHVFLPWWCIPYWLRKEEIVHKTLT